MWDIIKKELSNRIAQITIATALLLLLVFGNYVIDNHIAPRIKTKLASEGYLDENIKKGRFIVVNSESFSKNNKIDPKEVTSLKNGEFSKNKDLKEVRLRIENFEKEFRKELIKSQEYIQVVKSELAEQNKIIEALTSKKLKVTLFVSNQEIDKGYIVLNLKNSAISHLIENGTKYYIYGDLDSKERLRARVEIATDENFPKNSAIGRVHEDIYHELFAGSSSGARKATIVLE